MSTSQNMAVSHHSEPATQCVDLTSQFSDSTDLTSYQQLRGLYIGLSGDLRIDDWDGTTVTFKSVPIGILPVKPRRIHATGTAASFVIGLK